MNLTKYVIPLEKPLLVYVEFFQIKSHIEKLFEKIESAGTSALITFRF